MKLTADGGLCAMDDLLADFVAETREMLEAIEGEIIAWEADPLDPKPSVQADCR